MSSNTPPGYTPVQVDSVVPFQDQTGNQMQQLGQAAQGLGQAVQRQEDRLQMQLDESSATEALMKLGRAEQQALRDPESGFLFTVGRTALERRQQTIDDMGRQTEFLAGTLQTPLARRMFQRQAGQRALERQQLIDGHAGREAHHYDLQTTSQSVDQYADEAIQAYGEPDQWGEVNGTFNVRKDLALGAFDKMAKLQGLPVNSPRWKHLRHLVTGKIHSGVVDRLVGESPQRAQQYLRGIESELDPATAGRLAKQVQDKADETIGTSMAISLMDKLAQDETLANSALNRAFQKGAMTIGAFKTAQQQLATQARFKKDETAGIKVQAFEEAKAWAIKFPMAPIEQLPAELAKGLDSTYQRDDMIAWLNEGKRVASNPITEAELDAKDDAWWKEQTPTTFRAEYGGRLSEKKLGTYLGRMARSVGTATPEQERELKEKDLDRIAATEGGVLGTDGRKATSEDLLASGATFRLDKFRKRVDELAAMQPKDTPPAEARQNARLAALREKEGNKAGIQWRWEMTDEERAKTPLMVDGEVIDLSVGAGNTSTEELEAAMMEAARTQPAAKAAVRLLREAAAKDEVYRGIAENPWIPRSRVAALRSELMAKEGIQGVTETDIAQIIMRRRKQERETRRGQRAHTPGWVSWDTLMRHRVAANRAQLEEGIRMGEVPVGSDDLAFDANESKVAPNPRRGEFSLYGYNDGQIAFGRSIDLAPASLGISRAAATRLMNDKGLNVQLFTAEQAANKVRAFHELAATRQKEESTMVELTKKHKRGQLLETIGTKIEELENDGTDDADVQLQMLRAEREQLVAETEVPAEMALMAAEAWEAWLQHGGEKWEAWKANGKRPDENPMRSANVVRADGGQVLQQDYVFEQHETFRRTVEAFVPKR